MGKGNRNPENGTYDHAPTLYVARTIRRNERRLHRFSTALARKLGQEASIKTVESMHVTFMSSHWLRNLLRDRYSTRPEMRGLAGELEKELADATGKSEITVRVDRDVPLAPMGKYRDLLGLILVADPVLLEQRRVIEDYFSTLLKKKFPPTVPFMPHITLGKVYDPVTVGILQHDVLSLAPDDVAIPKEIALNGIECFLGRIHEQEHTL